MTTGMKSARMTFILCVCFGFLGAHHFYLRRYFFGFVYLMTLGVFGIGYIIDIFRIETLVDSANSLTEIRTSFDTYVLWFPLGILGLHHFYLNNYGHGVLYLFTFGVGGIGWLIDFFRIPKMINAYNSRDPREKVGKSKSVLSAYLFALTPFGILGSHHYYLKRWKWGLFYTLTGGALGIGYLFDLLRLPIIVERANRRNQGNDIDSAYLDEVILLWLTFGIFGFHHFYLKSYSWAILYFCTLGIFGLGWMADAFRISCLVDDYNSFYETYDFEITELNLSARSDNSIASNHNRERSHRFDDLFSSSFQNASYVSTNQRDEYIYDLSINRKNENKQTSRKISTAQKQEVIRSFDKVYTNHRQERTQFPICNISTNQGQDSRKGIANESTNHKQEHSHAKSSSIYNQEHIRNVVDIFTVSYETSNKSSTKPKTKPLRNFDDINSIDSRSTNVSVISGEGDLGNELIEKHNKFRPENLPKTSLGVAPLRRSNTIITNEEDNDDEISLTDNDDEKMFNLEDENLNQGYDKLQDISNDEQPPVRSVNVQVMPVKIMKSRNTQIHTRVIYDDLDGLHGLPPLLINVGKYRMRDDDVLL